MSTTVDTITRRREDFPALHQTVYDNRPLIYFDNAATTQKPQSVIDALTEYYTRFNANVHRGVHYLSQVATDRYEQARQAAARYIGAEADEIVFVRGTTEAINLVAYAFGETLEAGDEIILSAMEHHANLVPWHMLKRRKNIRLRFIPVTDTGELDLSHWEDLFTERTRLLSITYASNTLGTINPIPEMIATAHRHGVPVLVDAAQIMVHGPLNVQQLDADFLAFSAHKMMGPTGIGVLYGRRKLLEAMPPFHGGGEMIRSVTLEDSTYNDLPFKFEAGTPNIADAIAFEAAVQYLSDLPWESIQAYEQRLTRRLIDGLKSLPYPIRLIGEADHRTPTVSFTVEGAHHLDVGMLLDVRGIAVRTGHHCTMPLMQRFGVDGTVRASLAFYNTAEEVDAFLNALDQTLSKLLR